MNSHIFKILQHKNISRGMSTHISTLAMSVKAENLSGQKLATQQLIYIYIYILEWLSCHVSLGQTCRLYQRSFPFMNSSYLYLIFKFIRLGTFEWKWWLNFSDYYWVNWLSILHYYLRGIRLIRNEWPELTCKVWLWPNKNSRFLSIVCWSGTRINKNYYVVIL